MNSKKFKQIGIEYNSSSQGKLQKDELEYANSIFVTALSDRQNRRSDGQSVVIIMCACLYGCVHVCMGVCTCECVFVCVCACEYVFGCVCMCRCVPVTSYKVSGPGRPGPDTL